MVFHFDSASKMSVTSASLHNTSPIQITSRSQTVFINCLSSPTLCKTVSFDIRSFQLIFPYSVVSTASSLYLYISSVRHHVSHHMHITVHSMNTLIFPPFQIFAEGVCQKFLFFLQECTFSRCYSWFYLGLASVTFCNNAAYLPALLYLSRVNNNRLSIITERSEVRVPTAQLHVQPQASCSHTCASVHQAVQIGTGTSWELNRHSTRHISISPVSVDLQVRLVSGWGL